MSGQEEEGGGKRKREGGRGQGSSPQSQGTDTQTLADGMRRTVERNGSWLPGNRHRARCLLSLGKPPVEGGPAKLRRLRASHTRHVEGGVGKAGISPAPSSQPQLQGAGLAVGHECLLLSVTKPGTMVAAKAPSRSGSSSDQRQAASLERRTCALSLRVSVPTAETTLPPSVLPTPAREGVSALCLVAMPRPSFHLSEASKGASQVRGARRPNLHGRHVRETPSPVGPGRPLAMDATPRCLGWAPLGLARKGVPAWSRLSPGHPQAQHWTCSYAGHVLTRWWPRLQGS